jgi:sugar lactone lactonase YvrE
MSIRSRRPRTHLRHLGTATFIALALAGAPGCDPPVLPSAYVVPGNDTIPEGITIDEVRGEIYTTSVAHGTVFRGRLRDSALTEFLPPGSLPINLAQDGRNQTLGITVDPARNRLFVCGGGTGLAFVYDSRNGQLLGRFKTDVTPPAYTTSVEYFTTSNTLVNDVIVQPSTGDAFFTDSIRPILWRLPASAIGQGGGTIQNLEPWLDFTGTPLVYPTPDPNDFLTTVNANGIALTPDGQYFIIVQTNTGRFYRVTVATKQVIEITDGPSPSTTPLTSPVGAGITLGGNTIYVVSPIMPITRFTLAADYASGTQVPLTNPPTFINSSAVALSEGRLYVVNAQILTFFDGDPNTNPTPPFTISALTPP